MITALHSGLGKWSKSLSPKKKKVFLKIKKSGSPETIDIFPVVLGQPVLSGNVVRKRRAQQEPRRALVAYNLTTLR